MRLRSAVRSWGVMRRSAETLFMGAHTNKVDTKGRIAAPADFRRALKLETYVGFYCVPSLGGPYLECGGADFVEYLHAMVSDLDPYDKDRVALEESYIGQMRPIPFDSDGRFILPKPLRDFADIGDQAHFIGCGATFRIRNPEDAEQRLQDARERARGALSRLRNPSRAPNGGAA